MAGARDSLRPHLSVVVPAVHDADRVDETLSRIAGYLSAQGIDGEILVVDDGSSDPAVERAAAFLKGQRGRLLGQADRPGRGHALRSGLLQAEGRWVLIVDAHLSVPIEEHARLAETARDYDLDLVSGAPRPGRAGAGERLATALCRRVLRLPEAGPLVEFKLIDRERARPLLERMVTNHLALAELLFLCHRLGMQAREIPIQRAAGQPLAGLRIADLPRALLELSLIRWRYRRGLYHPEDGREP